MTKTEFRVRPVVRYVVTRFTSNEEDRTMGSETLGEFDHEQYAEEVACAMRLEAAAHMLGHAGPTAGEWDEHIRSMAACREAQLRSEIHTDRRVSGSYNSKPA